MKRTLILVTVALVSLGLGYFIGAVKNAVDEKFATIAIEEVLYIEVEDRAH
jgi:hypothetical protein